MRPIFTRPVATVALSSLLAVTVSLAIAPASTGFAQLSYGLDTDASAETGLSNSTFVGIADIEFQQPQPDMLTIVIDADLPLTYHHQAHSTDKITLTFPNSGLSQTVAAKLSAMANAVGLTDAIWEKDQLQLSGPSIALRKLTIDGASPIAALPVKPHTYQAVSQPKNLSNIIANTPAPKPPPKIAFPETPPANETTGIKPPTITQSSKPNLVSKPSPPTDIVAQEKSKPLKTYPESWSIQQLLDEAQHTRKQGEYHNAINAMVAVSKQTTTNIGPYWAATGELALEGEYYQHAADAFQQALIVSPANDRPMLLDRLAVACRQITPPSRGYELLTRALNLYPDISTEIPHGGKTGLILTPWLLGELAIASGQPQAATTPLLRAYQRLQHSQNLSSDLDEAQEDSSRIAYQLGLAYELLNQPTIAYRWYTTAVELNTQLPKARLALVRLQPSQQRSQQHHGSNDTDIAAVALSNTDKPQLAVDRQVNTLNEVPPQPTKKTSKHYQWLQWRQGLSATGGPIRPNY